MGKITSEGIQRTLLQSQDLGVGQVKEPCIRINTRELNKELCTRLSILYTNT